MMTFDQAIKFVEALIFCSEEPLTENYIKKTLEKHKKFELKKILKKLEENYKDKGINLVKLNNRWFFKTALSLGEYLKIETEKKKKLSKATI